MNYLRFNPTIMSACIHFILVLLAFSSSSCKAYHIPSLSSSKESSVTEVSRRALWQKLLISSLMVTPLTACADVDDKDSMYAPKFVQSYPDFFQAPEGYSYRIVREGSGEPADLGDRVVYDWSGVTIGYFGRPFQAKGGPQGGAFDKELDYARTVLGQHEIVKGLELALQGMKAGEVRQVIVPFVGQLSYPPDDLKHERVGPRPSTFSGQRALNFVLENPRLDRTLLFNIKVVRIDKPNGRGGFTRG